MIIIDNITTSKNATLKVDVDVDLCVIIYGVINQQVFPSVLNERNYGSFTFYLEPFYRKITNKDIYLCTLIFNDFLRLVKSKIQVFIPECHVKGKHICTPASSVSVSEV